MYLSFVKLNDINNHYHIIKKHSMHYPIFLGFIHHKRGDLITKVLSKKTQYLSNFLGESLIEIKKIITYKAACFTTVDSLTLLSTGAYTDVRIVKYPPPFI